MSEINYQELKAAVTTLNSTCGTAIKVIGIKKDVMADEFKKALEDGLENIPADVKAFYDANFSAAAIAASAPKKTKLGNLMEDLQPHAEALGITIGKNDDTQDIENLMLETLDGLSEGAWDALPTATQEWDSTMSDLIKAELKPAEEPEPVKEVAGEKPVKAAKAAKATKEKKAPKAPKEKKAKGEPIGPRPGFKFAEGTSARDIMGVFDTLFTASKNEGVILKDLQDACEKAKIKSNNIKGRVATVIRYASLPEGGEQVVKREGKWFPK